LLLPQLVETSRRAHANLNRVGFEVFILRLPSEKAAAAY
jgi:hypothetical protein